VRSQLGRPAAVTVRPPPSADFGQGVVVVVGNNFDALARGRTAVRVQADAAVCSPRT
jgi:hypothetical protein